MNEKTLHLLDSRAGLGACASVLQSALFIVIALAALTIGIDRFVTGGFARLATEAPVPFTVLCAAFVAIALLGLAITPAEKFLLEAHAPGWAEFGGALAVLGHGGTVAFFSWWLAYALGGSEALAPDLADRLAPLRWGTMFELVFVGSWVWIIAWVVARHRHLPRGFLMLSVVKAVCFWFTFAAFVTNVGWMLFIGIGAIALIAGPAWHLWIAWLLWQRAVEPHHA